MGFFEKLHAKIELFKLEQRYTKRSRRTTFVCDAYYVDGEYIYGPTMTQKNLPSVKIAEVDPDASSPTLESKRKSVFGSI